MQATTTTAQTTSIDSAVNACRKARWFCRLLLGIVVLAANTVLLGNDLIWRLAQDYALRSPQVAAATLATAAGNLPWHRSSLDAHIAELKLQSGNPQEAVIFFRKALQSNPIDASLWSRYSVALFYTDEWDLGARAALAALDLAPHHPGIALEQAAIGSQFFMGAPAVLRKRWQLAAASIPDSHWPTARAYLIANHREQAFCALLDERAPARAIDWCQAARTLGDACRTAPRETQYWRVCRRLGYGG